MDILSFLDYEQLAPVVRYRLEMDFGAALCRTVVLKAHISSGWLAVEGSSRRGVVSINLPIFMYCPYPACIKRGRVSSRYTL